MFSKRSRYYRLKDTAHPDRSGIERNCKSLRKLPEVSGQFLHTLEASDRLDHLAYKYYRQSLHWWRICDANPQFTTPLALLDKTPDTEIKLILRWEGGHPPLSLLYTRLEQMTGIVRTDKGENGGQPEMEIVNENLLFSLPGAFQTELNNAVRTQQFPAALDAALQTEALNLAGELRFSKPGEALWQVSVNEGEQLFRFHYSGDTGLIAVAEANIRMFLAVTIVYNRNSRTQQEIDDQIIALGFVIDESTAQTRIGQSILIPPRYTGKF